MNQLKRHILFGILFVSVLGTLFHFFYEWSGQNAFVGLFAPVNESVWEHLKLLFFPMLLYSLFLRRLNSDYPCIVSALFAGMLCGCALIPVLFYTYSGVLGKSLVWMDISIFYISVITAFVLTCRWASSEHCARKKAGLYFLVLLLTLCFFLFTFVPPAAGLWH